MRAVREGKTARQMRGKFGMRGNKLMRNMRVVRKVNAMNENDK